MLVNEARRDQVVCRPRQSGGANIRLAERREYLSLASAIQHFGRGINAVDPPDALIRQPCGRAAGSAAEIRAALDGTPPDAPDLTEQPQIHVTLDRGFVGC